MYGKYSEYFVKGGYVAIGWLANTNLSSVKVREELYHLYQTAHPDDTSNVVIGQQVGQIARFLLEIQTGDYVISPDENTDVLHYGVVQEGESYYYDPGEDGCPFRHRRKVEWAKNPLSRSELSVPMQNTLRSSLTVFAVSQTNEFFKIIGQEGHIVARGTSEYDPYEAVLNQVLELDDKEFEILITHLLAAMGFEGAEHTGKTGDGGVDARGILNAAGLARVELVVQAKRYKLGSRISANTVKSLRNSISRDAQGAFITTADYDRKAAQIAVEPGFPRIGLVNGKQLVDLLVEHWENIPPEFQQLLGLKPGLVKV